MTGAHTQGPWTAISSQPVEGWDGFTVAAQPSPALRGFVKVIAEVHGPQSDPERQANARLIAALPSLVEALRPFAAAADKADEKAAEVERLGMGKLSDNASSGMGIKFGHLRRAREVMASIEID